MIIPQIGVLVFCVSELKILLINFSSLQFANGKFQLLNNATLLKFICDFLYVVHESHVILLKSYANLIIVSSICKDLVFKKIRFS